MEQTLFWPAFFVLESYHTARPTFPSRYKAVPAVGYKPHTGIAGICWRKLPQEFTTLAEATDFAATCLALAQLEHPKRYDPVPEVVAMECGCVVATDARKVKHCAGYRAIAAQIIKYARSRKRASLLSGQISIAANDLYIHTSDGAERLKEIVAANEA